MPTYIRWYVHTCLCTYSQAHMIQTCIHMYILMHGAACYLCLYVYVYMYVYIYLSFALCLSLSLSLSPSTYIYICTCSCTHLCNGRAHTHTHFCRFSHAVYLHIWYQDIIRKCERAHTPLSTTVFRATGEAYRLGVRFDWHACHSSTCCTDRPSDGYGSVWVKSSRPSCKIPTRVMGADSFS